MERWRPYAETYDPLKCGSIDGTDTQEHDNGIKRALKAVYKPDKSIISDARCTLFVGRLSPDSTEYTIRRCFERYGRLESVKLILDIVTGFSKCYAFVEFRYREDAKRAHGDAHELILDGSTILVEFEHGRTMKGWVPRRMGGGFGGKKESGQLRFGGRDRPFKRPINLQQENKPYSRRHESRDSNRHRRDRAGGYERGSRR